MDPASGPHDGFLALLDDGEREALARRGRVVRFAPRGSSVTALEPVEALVVEGSELPAELNASLAPARAVASAPPPARAHRIGAPARLTPHGRRAGLRAAQLMTSVPFMPAAWWPSTGQ